MTHKHNLKPADSMSSSSMLRLKRRAFLASLTAFTVGGIVACQQTPPETPSANSPDASGGASPSAGGANASLNGAGASFPAPLYQRWFSEYNKQNPGVQISYQSVGSGAGVEQFLAGTVDFAASDAPLKAAEREQFQAKFGAAPIQIPMTAGSVVFAYNLPGVEGLKLSRAAYCGIVSGKITNWNDPAIAQDNAGVALPDREIEFVHRSDGSGTTYLFTSHLQEACTADWTAGADKSVEWAVGTGAKGNEGITAQVQQTEGAVGYVEYAYAKENGLAMASIQNKAGNFIEPSPESGSLAFDGQTLPEDFALTVPDPAGAQAYPISGLTWLLLYPTYSDAAKGEALKNVVNWAFADGKQYSDELGYIALPASITDRVKTAVDGVK
jgi:phosphate transport system substrate-binding protein